MYDNFLLILCGPTGVGKTELSCKIGERYPIEIINCDIGQFYEPLSIGTAKPAWKHHHIKHHLFDIVKSPEHISVTDYRKHVEDIIREIWARGALPVVVGGSMFYIKSLFFPPLSAQLSVQAKEYDHTLDTTLHSSHELWEKLHILDPARALSLHKNDRYRIERALYIWNSCGVAPTTLKPIFNPIADFHLTFMFRNREELYAHINQRTEVMLRQGWIDEVIALSHEWQTFITTKKIIGYPEISAYIQQHGNTALEQGKHDGLLLRSIQQSTRHYAKRQITFWRSLQRMLCEQGKGGDFCEFNATLSSSNEYFDVLEKIIQERCKKKE